VKSVDVSKQKAVKSSVVVSTKTEKKQAKPVAKSVEKTTSKQSASLSVSNKGKNTIATSKTEKKDSIKTMTKKVETKDIVAPKTEKSSKKLSPKNATKENKEATPSNDLTSAPNDEPLIELELPAMPPPLQLTLQEKKPASRSKSSNKASEKPSAAGLEAMKMPEGKGAAAFAMHPKEEKPIIKPSTKKVRYSDVDLKMFRQHIQKIKDEALEKEKTYAQMNRIFDYIKKLDDAIKRIDDKTYGICKECNILIAKARLLAVPITTQSASYKIHGRCPDNGIDIIAGRNE